MKRDHGTNDCLTCCIAFLFNLHPMRVPFFVGSKNWRRNVDDFIKRRGFSVRYLHFRPELLKKEKYQIVQGLSPRGLQHVVIYKGKKPHYDPNWKGGFLKGKPKFYWEITRLSER